MVGKSQSIALNDMGSVELGHNEQITFMTEDGKEYDVCRKEWGYYATPSLNDRLRRFGFKTALAGNAKGQRFIMLVEDGKEEVFLKYLKDEDNFLVQWLDEDGTLGQGHIAVEKGMTCPVCKSSSVKQVAHFDQKPDEENDFAIENYSRTLKECENCRHLYNNHDYDMESFYSGHYAESVYKDSMREKFEKIINLPEGKSDNKARVQRIIEMFTDEGVTADTQGFKTLDIGSGLCVFLYELKKHTGWPCSALDPDPQQAEHARSVCGLDTVTTGVMEYEPSERYNFVSLNKVLEHFEHPETLLHQMKKFLPAGGKGYVYIEVPDGEYAARESYEREEFFIEHFHAFSYQSFANIMMKTGYEPIHISRIREPSGKYTLFCFATATGSR